MSGPKRETPRGRGVASEGAQLGELQADSKLVALLQASLALPGQHIVEIPGTNQLGLSPECLLIALAIRDRCRELGGVQQVHIERALQTILQGGARNGPH